MVLDDFKKAGIPLIGFGPGAAPYKSAPYTDIFKRFIYRVKNHMSASRYVDAVATAFDTGFRLLDYSMSYGNGSLLNQAIKKSGVRREDLFVTSRVSNPIQCEHTVREKVIRHIESMGVGYLDLLQFHWPVTGYYLDTWREMEKLYEEGYVKHLGVANCHQHHLEEIFSICKYRPEIGQFEIHPLFTQKPLIQFYKDNDIIVEAYTPIARYDARLVRLPLLKRLEKKYNKTFVQIILRWHVQNGVIPLVRTLSKEHQLENISIFDFELEPEDMAAIDGININSRLRYDPDNCDFSIL